MTKQPVFKAILALCLITGAAGAGTVDGAVLPACATNNLAVFQSYGSEGCQLGIFTLSNFQYKTVPPVNAVNPTAAEITIIPPASIQTGAINIESTRFKLDGTNGPASLQFQISYFIDPPPVILPGFESELGEINFGDEFGEFRIQTGPTIQNNTATKVKLTTDLCAGGFFQGAGCSNGSPILTLIVFHETVDGAITALNLKDSVKFPQLVNTIDVRNTFELFADGTTLGIVGPTMNQTLALTPEPATWAMTVGALLLLAGYRRRRGQAG